MRILKLIPIAAFLFTNIANAQNKEFSLQDYHTYNLDLSEQVQFYFDQLTDEEKVAQLIMPAIGPYGQTEATIDQLVKDKKIGGLLLLNGTKDGFTSWVKKYNGWNTELGALPFLYSADAEASLVNRKIINTTPVKKANTLKTVEEVQQVLEEVFKINMSNLKDLSRLLNL